MYNVCYFVDRSLRMILLKDLYSEFELFFPIKSITQNIKKYMNLIDIDDERNIGSAKWLLGYIDNVRDDDVREFLSDFFYKNGANWYIFDYRNIVLDERFEQRFQELKNADSNKNIDNIAYMKLFIDYAQKYHPKYQLPENFQSLFPSSDPVVNSLKKLSITQLFEISALDYLNKLSETQFVEISTVDYFKNFTIPPKSILENKNIKVKDLVLQFDGNSSIFEQVMISIRFICKLIKEDLSKKSPISRNCTTEYFQRLQEFINWTIDSLDKVVELSFSRKERLIHEFLKEFDGNKVHLSGHLYDVFNNYPMNFRDCLFDTEQNFNKLNKIYESCYVDEWSFSDAPTSVHMYFNKNNKNPKVVKLFDLLPLNLDNYENLLKINPNQNFIVNNETLLALIKIGENLDKIIITDENVEELSNWIKSGDINKETFEYIVSLHERKSKVPMKVI